MYFKYVFQLVYNTANRVFQATLRHPKGFCSRGFYRVDAVPVAQTTVSKH